MPVLAFVWRTIAQVRGRGKVEGKQSYNLAASVVRSLVSWTWTPPLSRVQKAETIVRILTFNFKVALIVRV